MSKISELIAKVKAAIAQFLEKLRAHPKLGKFFAPKEKKPENPHSPTVLFREGSLFTRLQLLVVFVLLIAAIGGVYLSAKMIFNRVQKNKSLLAESEQYQNELAEYNQRVKENASIISLGSFTTNNYNEKGEDVRVSLDLWARFSDPETAAYADSISIKVSDRISAALVNVTRQHLSLFTDDGKKALKNEVKRLVDPLLHQGKVMDVYFHNLVAQ